MLSAITYHVYSIERTFSNNNAPRANRRRRVRNNHENVNANILENFQEEGFNNDMANERENVNDNQSLDESHHSQNPQIDPGFHEEGRNEEGNEIVDNNNEKQRIFDQKIPSSVVPLHRDIHHHFRRTICFFGKSNTLGYTIRFASLGNRPASANLWDLLDTHLYAAKSYDTLGNVSQSFLEIMFCGCCNFWRRSELRPPRNLPQNLEYQENHPEMETNGQYYEGLRRSMIAASRYEGWQVEIEGDSD